MKLMVTVFLFSLAGLFSLKASPIPVAIESFENEANAPAHLFQALRSRIVDQIVNSRKFEVVERQRLASILSERELSRGGLTSPENLYDDTIMAAGFIVYGTILSLGFDNQVADVAGVSARKGTANVEIQLRIANANSGKILASRTVLSTKSRSFLEAADLSSAGNTDEQAIQDAIRDAAQKVVGELMDLAYPAKVLKVSGSEVFLSLSREQTEPGAFYVVFKSGEELVDSDTGLSLGYVEEYAGKVVITRLLPKYTVAEPIDHENISAFQEGMIVRRMDEEAARKEKKSLEERQRSSFESRF